MHKTLFFFFGFSHTFSYLSHFLHAPLLFLLFTRPCTHTQAHVQSFCRVFSSIALSFNREGPYILSLVRCCSFFACLSIISFSFLLFFLFPSTSRSHPFALVFFPFFFSFFFSNNASSFFLSLHREIRLIFIT